MEQTVLLSEVFAELQMTDEEICDILPIILEMLNN
jgi:hypothetical protein